MTDIGDLALAKKAMGSVASKLRVTLEKAAQMVVDAVVAKIVSEVRDMF